MPINNRTLAKMRILSGGSGGSGGGGGGGVASPSTKEVNFYDYDGTLLHSYSVEEAQALTELPALPEQPGLICQGWNYDLETIKAYNRAVNVGANYITDDGKTRLYIHLEEGRTSPMLGINVKGTVTVDWGDGTTPEVLSGTSNGTTQWTPKHEYSGAGDYIIALDVVGEAVISGASGKGSNILANSKTIDNISHAYRNALKKVEIGEGVRIYQYAFYKCVGLKLVTIPNTITEIGMYAFNECHSLLSATIPDGVNNINTSTFTKCYALSSVTIPDGVKYIQGNAFQYCYSLSSVTIPNGVLTIGSTAFASCSSLALVVIPNSVTVIENFAFQYCYSLTSLNIPKGVTSLGNSVFSTCYALSSVTIPDGVTSLGNTVFEKCYALKSVVIPQTVTQIGTGMCTQCYSLVSAVIPKGVTTIGSQMFLYCHSARYIDFSNHTAVPTLSATDAFYNAPSDCEIRVPAALYDEWIAATNWTTYASQIVAV